jgi:hypothetical protein
MIDYSYALATIYPGKQWSMNGDSYNGIVWHDNIPIPQAELDIAYTQYLYLNEYKKKREAEYPSINELVVALWERIIENNLEPSIALQVQREAIKDKYPRPEPRN